MQAMDGGSRLSVVIVLAFVGGCGGAEGRVEVLTYNVAGLPEGLSSSQPERFIPQISPKLNRYDLVLVQEDFAYHPLLAAFADHPYRSVPKEEVESFINDGLNRFTRHRFRDHYRERWTECHGVVDSANDCLADKGFSVATHVFDDGAEVVVYNLHADAGNGPLDVAARRAEFAQLSAHVLANAPQQALIIAGDTNLDVANPEDQAILDALMADLGLEDGCDSVRCGRPLIDRVLFRSGGGVELSASEWRTADEMVDPEGTALSDHFAVHLTLEWRVDDSATAGAD